MLHGVSSTYNFIEILKELQFDSLEANNQRDPDFQKDHFHVSAEILLFKWLSIELNKFN